MRIILTTLLFLTFHMDAQEFSTKPSIKVYRQNFKNSNKIWRKYEFYLSGKEKIKHGRDYTSHSNGKKHVQKHWKNNKLHGTFKAWDKKGQLIKSGVFIDGKPEGNQEEWYSNGKPKSITPHTDGRVHGMTKKWFPSGKIYTEVSWKNGKKDGVSKAYFESGIVKLERHYKGDFKNGPELIRNPKGILLSKRNFKNDKLDGDSFKYYNGKRIHGKVTFKDGKKHGTETFYYYNGEKKSETNYSSDLKNGNSKRWNEAGKLIENLNYKAITRVIRKKQSQLKNTNQKIKTKSEKWIAINKQISVKNGVCEYFHPDGKKSQITEYHLGYKVNKEILWYENGNLQSETTYELRRENLEKDVLGNKKQLIFSIKNEEKHYYSSGQVREIIAYKDGKLHGTRTFYKEDGTIFTEAVYREGKAINGRVREQFLGEDAYQISEFKDGQAISSLFYVKDKIYTGVWREFYQAKKEQLKRMITYKDGKKHGIEEHRYEDDTLMLVCHWKNNMLNGPLKLHHANGHHKWACVYKNNKKHGYEKTWAKAGVLIGEGVYKDGKPWEGRLLVDINFRNSSLMGKLQTDDQGFAEFLQDYKDGKPIKNSLSEPKSGQK